MATEKDYKFDNVVIVDRVGRDIQELIDNKVKLNCENSGCKWFIIVWDQGDMKCHAVCDDGEVLENWELHGQHWEVKPERKKVKYAPALVIEPLSLPYVTVNLYCTLEQAIEDVVDRFPADRVVIVQDEDEGGFDSVQLVDQAGRKEVH